MSIIKKYFGTDKKKEEVSLAIITTPTTVILKGEKHFDIYEDGNGRFRAQHKSGQWLRSKEYLSEFYDVSEDYLTLEACQNAAIYYINTTQLRKVGTIEFIPSPKEKYDI